MNQAQGVALAREFVEKQFVERGMVADLQPRRPGKSQFGPAFLRDLWLHDALVGECGADRADGRRSRPDGREYAPARSRAAKWFEASFSGRARLVGRGAVGLCART